MVTVGASGARQASSFATGSVGVLCIELQLLCSAVRRAHRAIFALSDREPSAHVPHVSLLLACVPAKQRVQATLQVDARPAPTIRAGVYSKHPRFEHAVHWPQLTGRQLSDTSSAWRLTGHKVRGAQAASARYCSRATEPRT